MSDSRVVRPEDDLGEAVVLSDQEVMREAEASIYTGRRVHRHVLSEFTNDTELVLSTVATETPLVYAVGMPDEHNHTVVHALSTRDGARGHYDNLRTFVEVTEWRPFTELRRDWYVFFNGVVTLRDQVTKIDARNESIVLFPIGPEPGIQGELAWSCHEGRKVGEARGAGTDPDPPPLGKVQNLDLHDRLLDAWRANDPDAVARELAEDVGTALRDYVGAEPYHAVHGRDAARAYYAALFGSFEVRDVDLVNIVVGDWFVFAEDRWDAICRVGPHTGQRARFCTAVMYPLMSDGSITAQIGYGTDVVFG